MKELGIYIHIPFCIQKCYYCDFISYANKEEKIEVYIQALKKEIEEESKQKEGEVTTIYFGGGTPSLLKSNHIQEVIETIRRHYKVVETAEITIEVNPGTVKEVALKEYKQMGINRLSIGLQSTKNKLLKQIGRIHTYEEFLTCYELARKAGFRNINVDLMLGLPNQILQDVMESVQEVIQLEPEHISLYSLILEENTPLQAMIEKKIYSLPEEELERKMYWRTKQLLEKNKYHHYEISNFAKEGYESKHNVNCWSQKEYLGFGIAAHSYFNHKRYCNTDSIEEYIENLEQNKIERNRTIWEIQSQEEKKKEYMLLGLRKIEGVSIQEFKNQFIENPLYTFHKELEKLVNEELIEVNLDQIQLTNKGLDFANLVWEEFI